MARQTRLWEREQDDDPVSGLINFFDVWIVVVVALILALIQSAASSNTSIVDPGDANEMTASDSLEAQASRLPRFRKSESNATGQGELLGTAYRLQNGDIVYVPKTDK